MSAVASALTVKSDNSDAVANTSTFPATTVPSADTDDTESRVAIAWTGPLKSSIAYVNVTWWVSVDVEDKEAVPASSIQKSSIAYLIGSAITYCL